MSVTTIAKTKTPPKNSISQSDDVGLTFLMSLFPSNTFILAVVAAQFNTGSLVFLSWRCRWKVPDLERHGTSCLLKLLLWCEIK
jgi:hypothetical protein